MKKKYLVTMEVSIEIDDVTLAETLPAFNEYIFDTDANGLLSHIATMTATGSYSVEIVGDNNKDYIAKIEYTEVEEVN